MSIDTSNSFNTNRILGTLKRSLTFSNVAPKRSTFKSSLSNTEESPSKNYTLRRLKRRELSKSVLVLAREKKFIG